MSESNWTDFKKLKNTYASSYLCFELMKTKLRDTLKTDLSLQFTSRQILMVIELKLDPSEN